MNRLRPSCLFAYAACVLVVTSASARASDALHVTNAQVTITCPLTIGGSFEAKTTALSGSVTPDNAGLVKGALAVELMKLETGIALRDRHLRNNYLEVQKGIEFAVAKMENIKLQKLSGKSPFTATLMLHGQQHEISGTADVQPDGKGYKVDATFPVKISAFQIPEPTYLGVGVSDEVSVRVTLTAAPDAPRVTTSSQGTR